MFDALIQVPDSVFLQYFVGFSTVCITIGWLFINLDGTTRYPLPSPTRFGPIAIGALRSGRAGAIQTALFSLWRSHLLEISGSKENSTINSVATGQLPDNEVEKLLYQFATKPRKAEDFFTETTLQAQIEAQLKPTYRSLEKFNLVRPSSQLQHAKTILWIVLVLIGIVGSVKLAFDFYYSKSIVGSLIALSLSLVASFLVLQTNHLSRLGQNYLKSLSNEYSSLKKSLSKGVVEAGVNPAFGIAVFGVSILTGIAAFSVFESTFGSIAGDSSFGGGNNSGNDSGSGGCGGCGGG